MTDVDDLSGSTIAARFRLVRQLGRGGMGAVYLAEDVSLLPGDPAAVVAVKVIKNTLLNDTSAVQRFEREAVAVGKLKHQHIVGFRGTGAFAGVHWLAMEYLEGLSLRERISNTGAIPWRESLTIMAQIVEGLAAAHAMNVVHRDLKPDNVMLVAGVGTTLVKLLDFGIAKQVDAEAMTMTGTGLIVGTPGFIAPEVIVNGSTDDPRSDLYALGVVWFEMLTGTKPFDAPTPFALAIKHVQERPPRPNDVRPFAPVPAPIEDAVLLLLEKRPEHRPPTAVALGNLLQKLIHDADHPPEPSTSTMRTHSDLGGQQRTETGMSPLSSPMLAAQSQSSSSSSLPTSSLPTSSSPQPVARVSTPLVAIAGAIIVAAVVVAVVLGNKPPPVVPVVPVVAPVVVDAGPAPVPVVIDAGVVVVPPVVVDAGVPDVIDAGVAAPKPKGHKRIKPNLLLDP